MIKNIIATSLDLINVILKRKVVAQNKEHLEKLINYSIKLSGYNCDLNHIDVSRISDMSNLFYNSNFNGDISKWDTSNVTNMKYMFYFSNFNNDISQWNVSNVTDMDRMLFNSQFNKDISKWNTSKVKNMSYMFFHSQFNDDISLWKPYSLDYCDEMFYGCNASIPWWYSEDATEVVKKLKIHDLSQSLQEKLPIKNSKNKLKI